MGDRELVSLTFGDWNNVGDIDVITIEYEPIDDSTHVVHYTYDSNAYDSNDSNESTLVFQGELLTAEKWIHNFSGIALGRFDPNERPGLVLIDSICYDSSSAIEQWGLYDEEIQLESFPFISPAQKERVVACAIITDTGICETAYTNIPILNFPGDMNKDCTVDFYDFAEMAPNWNADNCGPGNYWCSWSDMNKDENVNLEDLGLFVRGWLVCMDFASPCEYVPSSTLLEAP
jgi:hypothetical protein